MKLTLIDLSFFQLVATKFLHDEGEQEEIYNDEWAEAGIFSFTSVNLTATQCRSLKMPSFMSCWKLWTYSETENFI